jgi:hypothetical protein
MAIARKPNDNANAESFMKKCLSLGPSFRYWA